MKQTLHMFANNLINFNSHTITENGDWGMFASFKTSFTMDKPTSQQEILTRFYGDIILGDYIKKK